MSGVNTNTIFVFAPAAGGKKESSESENPPTPGFPETTCHDHEGGVGY